MVERSYHRTEEVPFDQVVPDGNTGAYLYRTYIKKPDQPIQIPHGLGRPPVSVTLWRADRQCLNPAVEEFDADYCLVRFFESEMDVTLRIS